MVAELVISGYLLTKDHQKVHYDHYQAGHKEVVVIAHGFFNSKQALLLKELGEALQDDYDVILFDFRGHGKSNGLFYWSAREYQDLLAVLEYAHQTYDKIGVIGFSLGGTTSLITASKTDRIDSLVCVSAPSEFEKVDYHFWELDAENDLLYTLIKDGRVGKGVRPGPFWDKKIKPIDIVGQLDLPILYIHGDDDWVVKPWHSEKLFEKTGGPKDLLIIKNGPHAEYLVRKHKKELVQAVKSWFGRTLREKKPKQISKKF